MPESECRRCTHYQPRSALLAYDIAGRMESTQSVLSHERAQLSQLAQQAELDVRGYTDQLARIRAQMMEITVEQQAFQNRLAFFKSLLSPFRTLPVEVIVEIFSYCCADGTSILYAVRGPDKSDDLEIEISAAILGRVCRTWRKIISEHHSFWTTIDLQICDKFRKHSAEAKIDACIAHVLRASGSQLLNISIEDGSGNTTSAPVVRLVAESKRWRRAKLNFGYSRRATIRAFKALEGNLPLLDYLWIDDVPRESDRSPPMTLFANAPCLREISGWQIPPETFVFPWIQIQHATLHMSTPRQLGALLSRAVSIQTIEIYGLSEDRKSDTPADRTQDNITCNATTALLSFDKGEADERMISLLIFPCLRSCTIRQGHLDTPDKTAPQYEIFAGFFSHCRNTLTELTLTDVHFEGRTDFMAVLSIVKQLEVLSLHDGHNKPLLTKSILSSLDGCPSDCVQNAVLPRLKRLSININGQGDVEFLDLFSLVISRSAHPAPNNAVGPCRLENVFLRLGGQKCSFDSLQLGSMHFMGTGIRVVVEDEEGAVNLRVPAS